MRRRKNLREEQTRLVEEFSALTAEVAALEKMTSANLRRVRPGSRRGH